MKSSIKRNEFHTGRSEIYALRDLLSALLWSAGVFQLFPMEQELNPEDCRHRDWSCAVLALCVNPEITPAMHVVYHNFTIQSASKGKKGSQNGPGSYGTAMWPCLMCNNNPGFQEQQRKGVIVASDSNFSMAVAHHASELRVPVFVILCTSTAPARVRMCRDYGAMVISYGTTARDSQVHARRLAQENGYLYLEEWVKARHIREISLGACTALQKQLVSLKCYHSSSKRSSYQECGQLGVPRHKSCLSVTSGDVEQNETHSSAPQLGKLWFLWAYMIVAIV